MAISSYLGRLQGDHWEHMLKLKEPVVYLTAILLTVSQWQQY